MRVKHFLSNLFSFLSAGIFIVRVRYHFICVLSMCLCMSAYNIIRKCLSRLNKTSEQGTLHMSMRSGCYRWRVFFFRMLQLFLLLDVYAFR